MLGREGGLVQQTILPFYLGLGGRMGPGTQYMPWIHVKVHNLLYGPPLSSKLALIFFSSTLSLALVLFIRLLGFPPPFLSKRKPFSPGHHLPQDLASLIVHCLETPSCRGPYNAVSPHIVTNSQFVTAFASTLRYLHRLVDKVSLLCSKYFHLSSFKMGLPRLLNILLSTWLTLAESCKYPGRFQSYRV